MKNTLAVDIGNSGIKTGHFRDNKLLKTADFRGSDALIQDLRRLPLLDGIIIGAVLPVSDQLLNDLQAFAPVWVADVTMSLPIDLAYETPQTLGMDRLAAAVGAKHLFPGNACLVVDMGSCITYDFINANGTFKGGSISPGLQMRLQAMADYTAFLPAITFQHDQSPPLTGKSTNEALLSGGFFGVKHEVEGFIRSYEINNPDLRVLLTGGGAAIFASNLKSSIFAAPHLVLKGLNQILQMNA